MRRAGSSAAALFAAIGISVGAADTASANPVLLYEPETGQVLHAEEPDKAWYPASVTKLMTAYLTFEAVQSGSVAWDADVPLSEHARSQPATRVGLRGGIKLNVEQAVRGLVLRSANDFATALAERIGGTEEAFVETMNATAKRLGMTRTVFRNPHGLPDPEQVTTARDLAILTAALLKNFPDRAEVFSTPTVRIHKGTFYSQNDLLRTVIGADGMKTGFTCASGYNVVASATRDGHRLIAIVLGAVNREKRSARATELLEAGFAHLTGMTAITADTRVPHEARAIEVASAGADHARGHLHAKSAASITITPVALSALAVEPSETAAPPEDISRQLRSGKCRGYDGFAKKEVEPTVSHTDADDDDPHVVTSAVATPKVSHALAPAPKATAVAKQAPPRPKAVSAVTKDIQPKRVAPKPAAQQPPTQAVIAQKSAAPRKPRVAKQSDPTTPEHSQGDGN